MRKSRINITNPITAAEKFFIEKAFELLSEETIDTYRLRLNNPKSALEELNFLIKSFFDNNISEDYPNILCKESYDLIKIDEELVFGQLSKPYFLQLLDKKDLKKVYHATNVILNENKDYLEKIIDKVENEINNLNGTGIPHIGVFKKLNRLTSFLFVELRRKGFNKVYLHRTIRSIFSGSAGGNSFQNRFDALKQLAQRPNENFKIFVVIKTTDGGKRYVDNNIVKLKSLRRKKLKKYASTINQAFLDFIEENEEHFIYYIEVQSIDFYAATIESRKVLQRLLDYCFLGDDRDQIRVSSRCFVVGALDPSRAKPQNLNYKLDGDIRGSYDTFRHITTKLETLSTKKIERAAIDKISSGLRYLRIGTEAQSPEQRLINYWIAIEYIFSTYSGSGNKTTRLKEYFKKIHAYTYGRRLFYDLHSSIKNFGVQGTVSLFHVTNLDYLINNTTSTELFTQTDFPLLNFRLFTLNERFGDAKAIGKELNRHMDNLERNILRIYRVRNQIVHNAASDILSDDVFELSAHLKYYLIFTLNGLIEFLLNHPEDINKDKEIGIDDYFLIVSMKLESLMSNNSLSVSELLKLQSPIEYLK